MKPQFERKELYDALEGRYVRELRPVDIWELASTGGTAPGASGEFVLTSGTTDANHVAYIVAFGGGASANSRMAVVKGTSTILPIHVLANDTTVLRGTRDSPLGKVGVSTTVKLVVEAASATGTYTSYCVLVREPTVAKLEV